MGFSLVVAPVVEFDVKFTINDAGKPRPFAFKLTGERIAQEDLLAELKDESLSVGDFLAKHLRGWRGQTLVIDDATDEPAEFSEAALRALLSVTGVAGVALQSYLEANGAKGKTGN